MTELTKQEQDNVRAAIRVLRVQHGGFAVLAVRMHVSADHIRKALSGLRAIGANTAIRVAQAAGAPLEDVLSGRFPGPTACRHCGHPIESTPTEKETPDVH